MSDWNKPMQKITLIILFLLLITSVNAATIYGTIYDLSIKKVNNAIVEINTNPKQRYVAVNGTYQFEVPLGNYRITSVYLLGSIRMGAIENLTVVDDGIYILDLFLYPEFDDELYEGLDFEIAQPFEEKRSMFWLLFPIALIMSLFLFIIVQVNKRILKKELIKEIEIISDDLNKITTLLKKNKGRMTQKEIRKEIPLSEAKISLMIAELEELGKIKKIKRGRGNIIILK